MARAASPRTYQWSGSALIITAMSTHDPEGSGRALGRNGEHDPPLPYHSVSSRLGSVGDWAVTGWYRISRAPADVTLTRLEDAFDYSLHDCMWIQRTAVAGQPEADTFRVVVSWPSANLDVKHTEFESEPIRKAMRASPRQPISMTLLGSGRAGLLLSTGGLSTRLYRTTSTAQGAFSMR
jgi:hypothetical protein